MKIIMNTDNIETFLSRFDVAQESIYEAGRIAGEDRPCLNGITPKEALETLQKDMSSLLIPCIDRYMNKQTIKICDLVRNRVSKAKALVVVAETYQDRIPEDAFEHWIWRINKLVQRIERLEVIEKQEAEKLR